jgi:hypothetical protein
VNVEARNIPTGTVVDLQSSFEAGQNQTAKTSPLNGTADAGYLGPRIIDVAFLKYGGPDEKLFQFNRV